MAVLTRPGTAITLRTTPSAPSVEMDTGAWFTAGYTDRGPLAPRALRSMDEFITVFGARQTYSPLYDSLEEFFREGGNKAWVSRVVGPAATVGTLNLLDNVAAISLVASAIGPGAWSNQYKVQVLAGVGAGTFVIRVLDINNVVLEDSGDLATQAAAVSWANYSNYIRLTLGASSLNPAVVAATVLSTGADDRINATDTQWATALALFTKDLGPGQVSYPGRTSDTAHSQLVAHQQATNRVAIMDLPDTATTGTLTASVAANRAIGGGYWTPWITIPGITTGTYRVIPPSALVAGLLARNDPALGPNQPAAGRFGQSRFAYDLSQPDFGDTNRQTLNASGVNVIRKVVGASGPIITVFGWRSSSTDPNWIDFGNSRLFMALSARLDYVAQSFLFEQIDGQNGQTVGSFHDAIAGVGMEFFNQGQFFGDTPDTAFSVDTGPTVNTLTTIANNELHAVFAVRMAPMAELVQIEIVKRAVTEAV